MSFFDFFRRKPIERATGAPLAECVPDVREMSLGGSHRRPAIVNSLVISNQMPAESQALAVLAQMRGFPELTHERALAARKKIQQPRVVDLPDGTDFSKFI